MDQCNYVNYLNYNLLLLSSDLQAKGRTSHAGTEIIRIQL